MGSKPVLVATTDGLDTATLESAFVETPASITYLSDLTDLFDTLTHSAFYALVLPETVDDQSGTDIAYGVRTLFPDLPVIVAGEDPAAVPGDLDVTAVKPSARLEDAVAEAVRESLDAEPPSVAGRPPSPMETLLVSVQRDSGPPVRKGRPGPTRPAGPGIQRADRPPRPHRRRSSGTSRRTRESGPA